MDNNCIIRGKQVTLSPQEKARGEKFHLSRLAFAHLNGALIFNDNLNDDRDHQHWLLEDFGVTPSQFEATPRGYMQAGKIQLLLGSHFLPVAIDYLADHRVKELFQEYLKRFQTFPVTLSNGVIIGGIGEIWKPLQILHTLTKQEVLDYTCS